MIVARPARRRRPPPAPQPARVRRSAARRQLAEELTQETYAAGARPASPGARPGSEFHYLARTLRNVLHDHRRAERRQPALVSDEQLAETTRAERPAREPGAGRARRRGVRRRRGATRADARRGRGGRPGRHDLRRERRRAADPGRDRHEPPLSRPCAPRRRAGRPQTRKDTTDDPIPRSSALAVARGRRAAPRPPTAAALPDAEIFATNNTALITDPDDPRLRPPDAASPAASTRIIDDGGGKPARVRAARRRVLLLRPRQHDVRALAPLRRRPRRATTSCTTSPRRVRRRFLQQSVLTFDHLHRRDPDADAIELDVPHVSAQALRDGLLDDPDAHERLFGGSVTQDRHLLLVADRADADLARASPSGSAATSSAPSRTTASASSSTGPPRPRADREAHARHHRHRRDDRSRCARPRLEIDFGDDGVVDFEPSQRRFDRIRSTAATATTSSRSTAPYADDVRRDDAAASAVERRAVDVAGGDVEAALTVDDRLTVGRADGPVDVDLGAADGEVDRVVVNTSRRATTRHLDLRRSAARCPCSARRSWQLDNAEPTRPAARERPARRRPPQRVDRRMRITLDGGDGGDTLFGGPGDDVLIGGDDFDGVEGARATTSSHGRLLRPLHVGAGRRQRRVDGGASPTRCSSSAPTTRRRSTSPRRRRPALHARRREHRHGHRRCRGRHDRRRRRRPLRIGDLRRTGVSSQRQPRAAPDHRRRRRGRPHRDRQARTATTA